MTAVSSARGFSVALVGPRDRPLAALPGGVEDPGGTHLGLFDGHPFADETVSDGLVADRNGMLSKLQKAGFRGRLRGGDLLQLLHLLDRVGVLWMTPFLV